MSIRDLRADVPDGMAEVLRKMMAKDPAARFATPAGVAAALALWSDPPPPPPDPAGLPDWPPAVRRLLGLPAGAGAPAPASTAPTLPSSLADRAAKAGDGSPGSLPGWVALGSMAVGVVTAMLLAFRAPPSPPSGAVASPPSAGAVSPGERPRSAPGGTHSGTGTTLPDR
jgi:hypothetical protein